MSEPFNMDAAIEAAAQTGRSIGEGFSSFAAELAQALERTPRLEELEEAFKAGLSQTIAEIMNDVLAHGGSHDEAGEVRVAILQAVQASIRGSVQ